MMKIKKIFHHYSKWEEFHCGMWKTINGIERQKLLKNAIEFTSNAIKYGEWMMRVVNEWPVSCEQNLTAMDMNRQAWIGHAATCLAIGCPEDITRLAWHSLTQKQQDEANAEADKAIAFWEKKYLEKICLKNTYQLTFLPLLESA